MNYKLKQDDILKIELFGKLQDELLTIYDISLINFEDKHTGIAIINPCMDQTNRYKVDPVEYYGEKNIIKFYNEILDIEDKLMVDISDIPTDTLFNKLLDYYKNTFKIMDLKKEYTDIIDDSFEL